MMRRLIVFAALATGVWVAVNYFWSSPVVSTGKAIVVVTVPSLTESEKLGEIAFNKSCASCHGTNAVGQEGVAPPLIHKIYEPSHHEDMAFILAAKNGVIQHHWRFGNMSPVKNVKDNEIKAIIKYIRKLQRANGIQ